MWRWLLDDLLVVSDVARLLGLTPDAVRYHERAGRLPAQRTPGGVRVFRREDVEKFKTLRKHERKELAYAAQK
jgi:excisionase family DNA binding protein